MLAQHLQSLAGMGPRNRCVLLANDDPEQVNAITEVLEHLGMKVVQVASGADLVSQLTADNVMFDLVITDAAMPWMTALHVVSSTGYRRRATPMLVIEPATRNDLAAQLGSLGHDVEALPSPLDIRALGATVRRLMRSDRGARPTLTS